MDFPLTNLYKVAEMGKIVLFYVTVAILIIVIAISIPATVNLVFFLKRKFFRKEPRVKVVFEKQLPILLKRRIKVSNGFLVVKVPNYREQRLEIWVLNLADKNKELLVKSGDNGIWQTKIPPSGIGSLGEWNLISIKKRKDEDIGLFKIMGRRHIRIA